MIRIWDRGVRAFCLVTGNVTALRYIDIEWFFAKEKCSFPFWSYLSNTCKKQQLFAMEGWELTLPSGVYLLEES